MMFVHVGLHKTGTTYFQSEIFPHIDGVDHVRNISVENLIKLDETKSYIISREGLSGGVLSSYEEKINCLKKLSRMLPDANIIISFRKHSSYLNAIYSQYLRYGGTMPLDEFYDQRKNSGLIKNKDLIFRRYVESVELFWGVKPFVFVLSELQSDRDNLIRDLAIFMGVNTSAFHIVSSKPRNVSIGRMQAGVLRRINKLSRVGLHKDGKTRPYKALRMANLDPPKLCQHWSRLMPTGPIITPQFADRIDAYFENDWDYIRSYIAARSGLIGMAVNSTPRSDVEKKVVEPNDRSTVMAENR